MTLVLLTTRSGRKLSSNDLDELADVDAVDDGVDDGDYRTFP